MICHRIPFLMHGGGLDTDDEKNSSLRRTPDVSLTLLQQPRRGTDYHGSKAQKPSLVVQQEKRQAESEDKDGADAQLRDP
jgi:hypothetical protein